MRSDEPGCDYYCVPNCVAGRGKNHEASDARDPIAIYWVQCKHCKVSGGLMYDGKISWEHGYHMPD